MPWSAKAQELLRRQYAPTGAAAKIGLSEAVAALQSTTDHVTEASSLLKHYRHRREMAEKYVEADRRYCWPVSSLADMRLAPFHIMAPRWCGAHE